MYGIDVDQVLRSRSYHWLRARIVGLLDRPPQPAFNGRHLMTFPSTRIGWVLFPPNPPEEGGR